MLQYLTDRLGPVNPPTTARFLSKRHFYVTFLFFCTFFMLFSSDDDPDVTFKFFLSLSGVSTSVSMKHVFVVVFFLTLCISSSDLWWA